MSGQSKETKRERVVPSLSPGSSRVSSATGRVGAKEVQSTQMQQRSSMSPPKTTRSRQTNRSKQGNQTGKTGSSRKKAPVSSGYRAVPTPGGSNTGDTRVIQWVYGRWSNLEPHHRQGFFSILLLGLSLLLFGALTVFRNTLILAGIANFFLLFFGWSAYPLALGLIAFALIHLIEGIQRQQLLRWSMVCGLIIILLLLLLESRLLIGAGTTTGVIADVLFSPFVGWPPVAAHVITFGLLLLAIILTFRITFGHVLLLASFFQRLISDTSATSLGGTSSAHSPSPYLGQRPQFSRYMSGGIGTSRASDVSDAPTTNLQQRLLARGKRQPVKDELSEDNIEFEDDFENEEADLLNDINIHKQEVGMVPRGPRAAVPLDPHDQLQGMQGAQQQPLPFNQKKDVPPDKFVVKDMGAMEPLLPNPNKAPSVPKSSKRPPSTAHIDVYPNGPAQGETSWKLPNTTLLNNQEEVKLQMLGEDTATLARTIQETLRSFRVDAEVRQEDISIGPTIIRFGIRPTGKPEMKQDEKGKMVPVRDAGGNIVYETRTRVSRIMALQNDLALVLEAKTIRMEAPVPGRPYVGVEIPNKNSRLVTLREVLESKEYQAAKAKSKLAVALGKDVAGLVRVGDLSRMPHLLIAGATGAGKSVMINAIIASIVMQATPDDVRMLMVDPKMVELNMYNGIPHLLMPVVTEVEKVVSLLKNGISEMERRYRLFSQLGVRNLDGYRRLRAEKMAKGDTSLANLPAIIIIIDELADLMMAAPEEVEGMICRLAQLARATGIHLVVATQRPSVDVITGLIKANIPTRISFMVSSAVDSRTIIDMGGAERLLGRGDMLYLPADAGRPERIQGAFLADEEAERLVQYWREQAAEHAAAIAGGEANAAPTAQPFVEPGWELQEQASDEFELDDELLEKAEEVVREYGKASISLLQRRLRIGYSRAARLIDLLEEQGIIGHYEQSGRPREILGGNGDAEDHTMADEVADIMAEEKARNEFLKKQASRTLQQAATPDAPHNENSEQN